MTTAKITKIENVHFAHQILMKYGDLLKLPLRKTGAINN